MTEYIEKNKAIKELYEVYDYEFPTASGGFDEYARMIVPNTIKNMPAADVAHVRHGRWIIGTGENGLQRGYRKCSQCGEIVKYRYSLYGAHNFCNYCGCRMDGGAE